MRSNYKYWRIEETAKPLYASNSRMLVILSEETIFVIEYNTKKASYFPAHYLGMHYILKQMVIHEKNTLNPEELKTLKELSKYWSAQSSGYDAKRAAHIIKYVHTPSTISVRHVSIDNNIRDGEFLDKSYHNSHIIYNTRIDYIRVLLKACKCLPYIRNKAARDYNLFKNATITARYMWALHILSQNTSTYIEYNVADIEIKTLMITNDVGVLMNHTRNTVSHNADMYDYTKAHLGYNNLFGDSYTCDGLDTGRSVSGFEVLCISPNVNRKTFTETVGISPDNLNLYHLNVALNNIIEAHYYSVKKVGTKSVGYNSNNIRHTYYAYYDANSYKPIASYDDIVNTLKALKQYGISAQITLNDLLLTNKVFLYDCTQVELEELESLLVAISKNIGYPLSAYNYNTRYNLDVITANARICSYLIKYSYEELVEDNLPLLIQAAYKLYREL